MIENLLNAKLPPHLKKAINQAYLVNGTNEQIVQNLVNEMELKGMQAYEPMLKTQMTVVQQPSSSQKL